MKKISVSVRIQDTNADIIDTIHITKEEIEQIACDKAREEYPKKRYISAEGVSGITFI